MEKLYSGNLKNREFRCPAFHNFYARAMGSSIFESFSLYLVFCLCFLINGNCSNEISSRGYWIGSDTTWHATDQLLAESIAQFLKQEDAKSVVDFGCGTGDYVRFFLREGFASEGYDGNPQTPLITRGLCHVIDLSTPFDLEKKFDWVVSLEVGEHLPHQFESVFIDNLRRHAIKGIILSWAEKGQGGTGHFNEQNNDYIKSIFSKFGYKNDIAAENEMRKHAECPWFKNTIMVFRVSEK